MIPYWHDPCGQQVAVPVAPYNRRTGVERTNESVKDCGLESGRARDRVHARAQMFLALWLRLVVAITN